VAARCGADTSIDPAAAIRNSSSSSRRGEAAHELLAITVLPTDGGQPRRRCGLDSRRSIPVSRRRADPCTRARQAANRVASPPPCAAVDSQPDLRSYCGSATLLARACCETAAQRAADTGFQAL